MSYRVIEKPEWKLLKPTLLGGTDGSLYLAHDEDRILKLLFNFALYHGIEDKKVLLKYLMSEKSLKEFAAIPEELVFVPHKKRIGFWMAYLKNGVRLDEWTKQNEAYPEKVLKVYQRISEILKQLHEKYGIVVSDCYYTNILIINDEIPIFLDVDSWSMEGVTSYTTSNILASYSKTQFWNRYQQSIYLRNSKDADNAALWLMYLELVFHLPVRKFFFKKFSGYIEKQEDIEPIIKEIVKKISIPELTEIPYFHEVSYQYKLKK